MKWFFLLLLYVYFSQGAQAQFFNNFFDQQSTHLKNLKQQIAETEVYIKDIEKGCAVVESGLSTVKKAGLSDVNALISLTTANQLQMGDAQRIQRIQALDADMQGQNDFMQDFTGQTDLLCQQRQQEEVDMESMKDLYGLP